MADLTATRLPVATDGTHVADSAIRDDGATIDFFGVGGPPIASLYGDADSSELDIIPGTYDKGLALYAGLGDAEISTWGDIPLMLSPNGAVALTLGVDHSALFAGPVSQGVVNPNASYQGIASLSSSYNEIAVYGDHPTNNSLTAIGHDNAAGYLYTDSPVLQISASSYVRFEAADGIGVVPAAGHGLAVTFSYRGYGAVDFWNLTDNTGDGQGFSFRQKMTSSTEHELAWLGTYDGTVDFNISGLGIDRGLVANIPAAPANRVYLYAKQFSPLTLGFGGDNNQPLSALTDGFSPALGQMTIITDSTTNVWGATITGGGTNKVLAWYNGTAWTVMAK